MKPEALARSVYKRLSQHFGPARCPLHYSQPHELCIAVILSAQCTDERVNQTTPALFQRFPTVESFAESKLEELEVLIHSTGFFRNKARHIKGFCQKLVSGFGGKVPQDVETLRNLPGVGRKTANVISQELFGVVEGVVVDTHVMRLSKVLGLTDQKDPSRIEARLMELLPRQMWREWSLLLIFLGRSHCTARARHCHDCPLRQICPSAQISAGGV